MDAWKAWQEYDGRRTRQLTYGMNHWSLQEIVGELREMGYKGFVKIWILDLGRDIGYGLRELKTDNEFMEYAKLVLSTMVKGQKYLLWLVSIKMIVFGILQWINMKKGDKEE